MKLYKVILIILFVFSGFTSAYAQKNENLIVLVKYRSQPGKDSAALAGLRDLINKVKKEPHYVSITVHVNPADRSDILLYEQWSDEAYYKGDHLETKHLQQFMIDSRSFLAGPPEISFWNIASK